MSNLTIDYDKLRNDLKNFQLTHVPLTYLKFSSSNTRIYGKFIKIINGLSLYGFSMSKVQNEF